MRNMINLVGGLLMIGLVSSYFFSFSTADGRVRKLCGKVQPGMTIAELNRYAEGVGLGPPARTSGTSFLVERKTFGRYGCKVEAANGVVRTVTFDASN